MAIPKQVDYLIIGAGIHGLSTAWHLAEKLKAKGKGDGSCGNRSKTQFWTQFCSIFKKLLKILSPISESISSIGGETSVINLPAIFRLISPCFPDQRRWAMSPGSPCSTPDSTN